MPLTAHVAAALRRSPYRIVVTGARGWIGRATLDLLHDALGDTFAERVLCFGSRRAEIDLSPLRTIEQRPLRELGALPCQPTLVLHFAFLTKDRAEVMSESAYRAANRAIRQHVRDALDPIGAEAVFVASSGAAQYVDDGAASPPMRLYGMLKREDEDAFAAWAEARGHRAAIARIFNLSGPHINKVRSYALSAFLLDALAGGPVTVHARHHVRRGYVAIRELMSLGIALLLDPQGGVTRFGSGGEDIELGALAATIAAAAGCAVDRPAVGHDGADVYLGDDRRYRHLLDHHAIERVSLNDQIAETMAFLKNRVTPCCVQDPHAEDP